MKKLSGSQRYNVPGSYSIGEGFTAALVAYIMDNKDLFMKATRGSGDFSFIKSKYEAAAKELIGSEEEDMPKFMTFGIFWTAFGPDLVGQIEAQRIEDQLARILDVIDDDAEWEPLTDISVMLIKAGLDPKKPKTINSDFTKKIKSFKPIVNVYMKGGHMPLPFPNLH